MRPWFFWLLLVLIPAASLAQAVEKPPSVPEAKQAFGVADEELNDLWKRLKRALSEWDYEPLLSDQRNWIEYRDQRALTDATFNGGATFLDREKESVYYWDSLTWNTENRLRILSAWLAMAEDEADIPWEGVWQDDFGGTLYLFIRDQVAGQPTRLPEIEFEIAVVRGPTYHMGAIEGVARLNGNTAFFTDGGSHPLDEWEETWLIFDKHSSHPTMEVRGVNTGGYHGARAYFDGTYTRVEPMTDELRERIQKRDTESLLTGEE